MAVSRMHMGHSLEEAICEPLQLQQNGSFFAIRTLMFIASTSMTDMAIGAPHGTMTIPLALIHRRGFGMYTSTLMLW